MSPAIPLTMTVNGVKRTLEVHPVARLLDVLREDLGLTGTKEGCGEGECGACSILMNGRVVNSCLIPAAQAQGAVIVTVEGLAEGEKLSALQDAFVTPQRRPVRILHAGHAHRRPGPAEPLPEPG